MRRYMRERLLRLLLGGAALDLDHALMKTLKGLMIVIPVGVIPDEVVDAFAPLFLVGFIVENVREAMLFRLPFLWSVTTL